jgi:hypothetical protein
MLPIKRVVLFKHGVGHFEREGQIKGDASIDLYFRVSEMNDVLKSLTVLDLGEGFITSISYEVPVAEQLKDIAIVLPKDNAMTGLLSQMQGARVAIDIGQKTVTGTVIGIETIKQQIGETIFDSIYLSLLVEGSTLQSFDVMEAKQITLLDDNLKKDLQHLLDVLITAKKKDLKKLTVFLKGEGERSINISYIVAAPVWKTSYRLLLNEESPLIQGWALVDNTQDEDWENVYLSLVAGLPVSFTHDLYSPRYQKRPEVRVPKEMAYAPPISEQALEEYENDDLSLDLGGDEEVNEDSFLYSKESVPVKSVMAKRLARSTPVQTHTVEVGDLFQYEIENPVTVRRQQSALVPILQTDFSGKNVVVYNPDVRSTNPMSAVLFKNTTGLTLENGPITVFEDDAYVGETMLNILKPDEEQLLSYSVELGCVVSIDHHIDKQDVHQVRITHGNMYLYHYDVAYKTYTINNKTDYSLDFFLEHRYRSGWELVNTPQPVERTEHFYRFRFDISRRKTKQFTVTECLERSNIYIIKDTTRATLKLWLTKKYIDKKTLRALEGIINLTEQITQIQRNLKLKENAVKTVFRNQERIRQNLQTIGNTEDERGLRERYIGNLANEEDKLAQYQIDIDALKAQQETFEINLNKQIETINFKTKL